MSTPNDPYLTVPNYGQQNQNFGKEKLYSGYTAPSAVSDLAAAAAASNLQTGARTPDKGKYIYDSKTGQYIWVPATAAAAVNTGIAASPAYINQDRGGGRGEGAPTGDGYGPNSSPMSNSINGSFGYQAVDAYGNALGGLLPGAFIAQAIAQSMNPSQVEEAGKLSAKALQDAIAGYTSGAMFGAPPSDPTTFGGAGYGTPTSQGGYGVTGMTGAGVAAGGMNPDPAQAKGEGQVGQSGPNAANQAMTDAANAKATADAIAAGGQSYVSNPDGSLSPVGGGGGFDNSAPGAGFGATASGGIDGSMFNKGGQVTMDRLRGPNPMGPDDGYGGLDSGEFVINAKSVGKYGIELMNAINAGKISKGKLRGLLEA